MTTPPETAPEIAAEQAYLDAARAALGRMRARVEALDAGAAGDWVSRQFLESTFDQRLAALADDPAVPLFFGRLDTEATPPEPARRWYVGRRHVADQGGEPLVVDWRAPVSLPFYRARAGEEAGLRLGVERRRRYGFDRGRVTAYEDEDLRGGAPAGHSALLEAEIERPRVGPMRDIVATIQPEQDEVVRADLALSLCVQGAPGTGKTAVGLHRAAFLLYAFRDQLARQGMVVVGPNEGFLHYIRQVLPSLGELAATQVTLEQLLGTDPTTGRPRAVRATEPAALATLKGDARMAEVLRRAVWSHVGTPTETLVVPRGSRRYRVPAYEVEEVLAGLRSRGVRYATAGDLLRQALAHRVLVRMEADGDSPDDRVQDAVARSAPVKAYAAALWPALTPAAVLHRLLGDPAFLAAQAEGVLDEEERALLGWASPPRSPGTARWTTADVVLLDELGDLLVRTGSAGHLVLDEAQDLSAMMLRAVGRRCATGSVTVLGDLAQATTPWATSSWADALAHLGHPGAGVVELVRGFRVPGEVLALAARLLPTIAPDLAPPESVRRTPGELVVRQVDDPVDALVRHLLDREAVVGSTGVVVPDGWEPRVGRALAAAGLAAAEDTPLDVVPAGLVKGLEYDHVVLLEPAQVVAGEHDRITGLRRLYVCLTRAVSGLTVLHAEALPSELVGGAPERRPA